MIMYAINIYYWRKYRVNYTFIFGFKSGTELGYREVLHMSFGLGALALACVLSNLDMEMDPKTNEYKAFTELLPLNLVLVRLSIQCTQCFGPIHFPRTCINSLPFFPCCSLHLSSYSCHSTSCIDQVDSFSSNVCFTVFVLLYTR